jgi:hypothetical protein
MSTTRRANAQLKSHKKYHHKLSADQSFAAQRIGQLSRYFWLHCFPSGKLPDNEQGLRFARIMCRTMAYMPVDRREAWLDRRAPWLIGRKARAQILSLGAYKYGAASLGQALGLTDAVRTRLKIWSVLPIDVGWPVLVRRRKESHAMRQTARRRRHSAKPRKQWLAENSASRDEPWNALNISRRTYYRRGLHRGTGACALITSLRVEHGPVPTQSPAGSPPPAYSGEGVWSLMFTPAFTQQADHAGLWPVVLAMLAQQCDVEDYREAA